VKDNTNQQPDQDPSTKVQSNLVRKVIKVLMILGLSPILLVFVSLEVLFLWNSSVGWAPARMAFSVLFVLALLSALFFIRPWKRSGVLSLCLITCVFAWYWFLPPSNTRQWKTEVANTASSTLQGDLLTIQNVRNFTYRSVEDFDDNWETRTYDLSKLDSLDIYFSYWGPLDIAHTMLSFGFEDGEQLCLSVEVRKELDEVYSPIASFVKKFELIYILADERDLIALRSNYRKEDVFLYPSPLSPEKIQSLLLDILDRVNSLATTPEYYGTIKDNCTTALVKHLNKVRDEPITFSIDLLLNGHIPEMAWREGNIGDPNTPFEQVKDEHRISDRAIDYGTGPDFSRVIRNEIESKENETIAP
jgi:Domain of unknown function (DUF4105)